MWGLDQGGEITDKRAKKRREEILRRMDEMDEPPGGPAVRREWGGDERELQSEVEPGSSRLLSGMGS